MGQVRMKIKWTIGLILWVIAFLAIEPPTSSAQTTPPSLTVLYSNNINGEIDPCPV